MLSSTAPTDIISAPSPDAAENDAAENDAAEHGAAEHGAAENDQPPVSGSNSGKGKQPSL